MCVNILHYVHHHLYGMDQCNFHMNHIDPIHLHKEFYRFDPLIMQKQFKLL